MDQIINPNGPDRPEDLPYLPQQDYVFAEHIRLTESRIALPENHAEETIMGVVVAIGPGRTLEFNGAREPIEGIEPGDILVLGAGDTRYFQPIKIKWRSHDLIAVRARNAIAVRKDCPWGRKPDSEDRQEA